MVQCLTVDYPIAISSTNNQSLLDSVEEAKDCWKENFLGLILDSQLQHQDLSCLPSFIVDNLFEHGAVCYLSKWQFKVSKLSFLQGGYAVNRHNFIRFLCIAVIPFICQHLIMGVNGYGWTWQVPTTLTTYWCFSSNRVFALFQGCRFTMLPCCGWWKISGPCSKRVSR